ncbi:hypothetical protein F8O07_07080 [Pseudoclavibacter sp. CFCC 13796]|uniref:recombinase family protein n=1 Tax=Pseudoclavibacter sp. CFCC 13796 TaxID=2615179 RepID=UPI0013014C37|nr:recombinase family protein [Pseudoclavibacter sp. CFCC 13796]KAB1661662.1 hypothetical protein F8O07_07080 [Pseudoclavibacter sp. CFCC 13796]
MVRVESIHRLACNTRILLTIVDELAAKGAVVKFVNTPQLKVTTKEDRAMLAIIAPCAQLVRKSIRERQMGASL